MLREVRKYLSDMVEATFNQISEASRIVAFRNQVVYGDQVIQDAVTWQIIAEKPPV